MFFMILAGGSGTRLFPMSRPKYPKQFLDIDGKGSLLAQTIKRISNNDFIVVGGRATAHMTEQTVSEYVSDGKNRVLVEPMAKNTAPAIIYGLTMVPDGATVAVMPADHHIQNTKRLEQDLKKADRLAEKGYIVTLGITPDRAETGYGYIKTGKNIDAESRVVDKFVEKPDTVTAEKYIASEDYLWNSGMFVFKKETMVEEAARYSSSLNSFIRMLDDGDVKKAYENTESVSIDYAVMEKTDKAAVLKATFDWSDVGSWASVKKLIGTPKDNSVMSGELIEKKSRGNLVSAPNKMVILLGVNDLEVIDTDDVLLVGDLKQSQLVKDAVEELREKSALTAETHVWEVRPWGMYATLYEGEGYKVKRITVRNGEQLSLQYHNKRSEDWVIVKGRGLMHLDGKEFEVSAGDHVQIPLGVVHTITGIEDVEFVETQRGKYLGENDIVRLKDKYGRI